MELNSIIFLVFVLSAMAGVLTIPRIVLISKKKRLFDKLCARKSHTGAIPRLGGISFLPAFLFAFTIGVGVRYMYGMHIATPSELVIPREFMFLTAGATLLFCIGLADDVAGVGYKAKFVAQVLAAGLLLCSGVWISNLDGLFGIHEIPASVGMTLTVLVVVLLVNAYNLIDGIDGLCSGLSLLALATFAIWFGMHQIPIYAMMAMAMAGVVAVFFFYNVKGKRLKVFMGDTGSLLLGFLIAFLGLKFYDLNVNGEYYRIDAAPAVFLGIVFIPAFDTVRVFCTRMMAGLSPFYPDRRHIHHKLLRLGVTHLQGTLVLFVLQAACILLNFLLRNININILLVIDIVLGLLVNSVLTQMGNRYEQRHPEMKKNKSKK